MIPPYRDWPGADGNMTGSMWAWWFPNKPAWLGPVPIREQDQPAYVLGRGGGGGAGGFRGGFRGMPDHGWNEGESLPCGPGNYGPDCPPPYLMMEGSFLGEVPIRGLGQAQANCDAQYGPILDQNKAAMDNAAAQIAALNQQIQATDDPATIDRLFKQLDPLALAFDSAKTNYDQVYASYVSCLGAAAVQGVTQGITPGMGQDFSKKPTPPPCSTGYLPVIDRGVLKCIPASSPSGMTGGGPQQRTFPVKSFYGWTQW